MCSLAESRRQVLARVCLFAIALVLPATAQGSDGGASLTPQQVLDQLQAGNARYVEGKSLHPNLDSARRDATVKGGQHPVATILSCSDSRVPVELVLDQGIGDVFVVRVAGNVCNADEAASIEYGVDHVGTPLVIVLGHTSCGAVTAAATHAELHGAIVPLVAGIQPAVVRAQQEHPGLHGKDLVPAAIEANVWLSIDNLFKTSSVVRQRVRDGKLKVVGALYDVQSGKIQWLGERLQKQGTDSGRSSP